MNQCRINDWIIKLINKSQKYIKTELIYVFISVRVKSKSKHKFITKKKFMMLKYQAQKDILHLHVKGQLALCDNLKGTKVKNHLVIVERNLENPQDTKQKID